MIVATFCARCGYTYLLIDLWPLRLRIDTDLYRLCRVAASFRAIVIFLTIGPRHTTDMMIYRWFTITENVVVTRNAFKTHRVFSRWCLWQTASPRYQSPFCTVHDRKSNANSGNHPLCFYLDLLLPESLIINKLCRLYVNNRLN